MTQRKLPMRVEAEAGARSPACTERRLDEGARALGGGIGGAGSIWSKVTIETGWSSVKPENLKRTATSCARKTPLATLGLGRAEARPLQHCVASSGATSCAWCRRACD